MGGSLLSTSSTWRRSMKGSRIWCSLCTTTTRFSVSNHASPPDSAPGLLSPNHCPKISLSSKTCKQGPMIGSHVTLAEARNIGHYCYQLVPPYRCMQEWHRRSARCGIVQSVAVDRALRCLPELTGNKLAKVKSTAAAACIKAHAHLRQQQIEE